MKPVYDDDAVRIYAGDCLKVLAGIETVDHVITDPPYGSHVHAKATTNDGKGKGKNVDLGFDYLTPRTRRRIAVWLGCSVRRWSLIFCDAEGVSAWIDDLIKARLEHVRVGAWIKPNAPPQFTGDRPAAGFEAIEIAHPKGRKVWNGGGKAGMWRHNIARSSSDRHPTEKPASLMKALILDFTNPGDVILDPFCGSGSMLRAAKDLGRRAIGIERDPHWVEVAINRMAQEVLFGQGIERQASPELSGASRAISGSDQ